MDIGMPPSPIALTVRSPNVRCCIVSPEIVCLWPGFALILSRRRPIRRIVCCVSSG
jgi:hypothetical protein